MTSVTVDLNELRTLLTRVMPFAEASNHGLPVLQSVYLQGRGNHLTATATDRYVVGMARLFVDGADGFNALVKLKDAKHILSTFKTRRGIITKVELAATGTAGVDSALTISLADGLFAEADELTARYSLIDGRFPAVEKIVTAWEPPTETTGTGYNPTYLSRFANVTEGRSEPVKVLNGGTGKPTIVQAGDYFIGAIMPVRLSSDLMLGLDEWNKILNPPAAEKPNPVTKPRARRAKAKVA